MPPAIKLTYFGIAGRGEPVRLCFALGEIAFEDNRITFADWGTLKPTTPYGQLPVLTIDGGSMISQSEAMMRYAGRLAPAIYPAESAMAIDEIIGLVGDFGRSWAPNLYIGMNPAQYGYPADFKGTDEHAAKTKEMREQWIADGNLAKFVGFFEQKIDANGGSFLVGASPTIADCMLVPELRKFKAGHIDHVPTTCLDGFPKINAYIERFLAVKQIAAWYAK